MKIQQQVELLINSDGSIEPKIVGQYNKLLPITVPHQLLPSDMKELKYIGDMSGWNIVPGRIYVFKQLFPLWLFWWLLHRVESTLDLLLIGFVYILEVWGLANVPTFEKPSLKHIFRSKHTTRQLLSPGEIEQRASLRVGQLIVLPEEVGTDMNRSDMGATAPDYIGDLTCKHNARSRHLRCAINPSGPCNDCNNFDATCV